MIIEHDVDVSGCSLHCANGDCGLLAPQSLNINKLFYGYRCSEIMDCYYKQLQREKQREENRKNYYKKVVKADV